MLINIFAATCALGCIPIAIADSLNLYLGPVCNGENLGSYSPLALGDCIAFGEAESYLLQRDDGVTYNLYSGESCSEYQGQVTYSGCSELPPGADSRPTHVMNIGNQSKKRALARINSTTVAEEASFSKGGVAVLKRADGDSYQCPNTPYFFTVTSSNDDHLVTSPDIEAYIESQFEYRFMDAYEQGQQTQVQSTTAGPQGEDIIVTLRTLQGTIDQIIPDYVDDLIVGLQDFRDQQQSPYQFYVQIFTGEPGNTDGSGPFASFSWVLQ